MTKDQWKRGLIRLLVLIVSIVAVYGIGGETYKNLFSRLPFLFIFNLWGFALSAICYAITLVGRPLNPFNKGVAFVFSFLVPLTIDFLDPLKFISGIPAPGFFGFCLIPIAYSSIIFVCFLL
jgi:hypothetical protein